MDRYDSNSFCFDFCFSGFIINNLDLLSCFPGHQGKGKCDRTLQWMERNVPCFGKIYGGEKSSRVCLKSVSNILEFQAVHLMLFAVSVEKLLRQYMVLITGKWITSIAP